MKKYLLVIFGDFKTKKMVERIAKGITPLVDTPHLKFQHTKGTMIIHFGSEVSREEIYDFLTGILYGFTDTFILTEMNDNVLLSMSDDVKNHLMDLENNDEEVSIKIDMTRMSKINDEDEMDYFSEEFIGYLLDEFGQEIKTPTLNEILDKISDKGFDSLSGYEKELLENYSKNKI